MRTETTRFLGEEDYLPAMTGDVRIWREKEVRSGTIKSADQLALQYYFSVPEQCKAAVIVVHGLCEFFGKYHELVWYLHRAGYGFFFLEQRGHGLSEGKLPEPDADVIHIENYDIYLQDLQQFTDEVVRPESSGRPLLLFGHSMGGAIATLFLEKNPDIARAAVLSSPMFRLRAAHPSPLTLALMRLFIRLFRKGRSLAPGEHHFSAERMFNNHHMSEARFGYLFSQRIKDRRYQTSCASLAWVIASILAIRKLQRHAKKIRVPVALLGAGDDRLVDPVGHELFLGRVPHAEYILYPNSGHEIYNAEEEIRKTYYADLFRILRQAVDGTI